MTKQPTSVTILSWLFILVGSVGLAYHVTELKTEHPFELHLIWILFIRLLAIAFGIFMLRGSHWARWGVLVWMVYHVVLSAFHSLSEFVMHYLLLALFAYVLLRPRFDRASTRSSDGGVPLSRDGNG